MITPILISLLTLLPSTTLAEPHIFGSLHRPRGGFADLPAIVPQSNNNNNLSLNRRRLHKKRGADPSTLSTGSLTTAEGCTQFYNVPSGSYCILVADKFGITLDEFYAMNPQVDGECLNLWAGYDYCVARTSSSSSAAPTTTSSPPPVTSSSIVTKVAAVAQTTSSATSPKAVVHAAAKATSSPTPTSTVQDDDDEGDCDAEEEETSTAVAAAPTATPSSSGDDEEDDDDDEYECVDDDEESSSSSSSSSSSPTVVAAAAVTKTTAAAAVTTTKASSSGSSVNTFLASIGVTHFLGENTGIGSWFHADSSQDSTNGHSWCYFPYQDSSPGFAIDLSQMLDSFNGDAMTARKAYCGLEATVTAPDGTTATGYVIDAFDHQWVRTPGSIDIMYDLFTKLHGSATSDKNTVMQGVKWSFTGNKSSKYSFNAAGDP
ncbi:hypothetical protein T439DRAFT_360131 [Meredithblackwellia eburnea MCA 4105]